ncbi:hypothetical protein CR513_08273, partial [Mucuna pruriens]
MPRTRDGTRPQTTKKPYIVKHSFSVGALILTDPEGHDLIHPIHTDMSSIEKESKGLTPSLEDGGVSIAGARGTVINSQQKALGWKLVLTCILLHGIPKEGLML